MHKNHLDGLGKQLLHWNYFLSCQPRRSPTQSINQTFLTRNSVRVLLILWFKYNINGVSIENSKVWVLDAIDCVMRQGSYSGRLLGSMGSIWHGLSAVIRSLPYHYSSAEHWSGVSHYGMSVLLGFGAGHFWWISLVHYSLCFTSSWGKLVHGPLLQEIL